MKPALRLLLLLATLPLGTAGAHAGERQSPAALMDIDNQIKIGPLGTLISLQAALAVCEASGPQDDRCLDILFALVEFATDGHDPALQEVYARRSLIVAEQALPPDHPDIARAARLLARALEQQSKFAAAIPLYTRALQFQQRLPDRTADPLRIELIDGLARSLAGAGRYQDAEPYLRQGLAFAEAKVPLDALDAGDRMLMLAQNLVENGRYADAQILFLRILDLGSAQLDAAKRATTSPWWRIYVMAAVNLGRCLREQGMDDAADKYFRSAATLAEHVLFYESAEMAETLAALGQHLNRQSAYAEAEPFLRRALKIREQDWPPIAPADLASSLHDLAVNLTGQRRLAEAEPYYIRALAMRERLLPESHPDRIVGNAYAGRFYFIEGRSLPLARARLKDAGRGVLDRITQYAGFDQMAQTEMIGFRAIFLLAIRTDWRLANGAGR